MWVKFTSNFKWRPLSSVTISYKAGSVANVTRMCGSAAVEQGKAELVDKKRKDEDADNGQEKNDCRVTQPAGRIPGA